MMNAPTDHAEFLSLLPALERHARVRFRFFTPAAREEAVADALAYGFMSFTRLRRRGKSAAEFPAAFARFTARAVANGRGVGRRTRARDVMCRADQRRGFTVHQLDAPLPDRSGWWRDVIADPRTNVATQAALAIDFPTWMGTLPHVKHRCAELLAHGYATDTVARLVGVTPGRVSQVRRELAASWAAFHAGR